MWTKDDILEYKNYLLTFSRGKEKSEWEKRIVNTNLKTIAVSSQKVKEIADTISKGNFLSFINLWIWETYTDTAIIGNLIGKIKDINILKSVLLTYAKKADCWATTDVVKLKINSKNVKEFFNIACEFINSEGVFVKRLGIVILLKIVRLNVYIDEIFLIINSLGQNQNYYVQMALAWLISETFIYNKNKTLLFLKNNNINYFIQNKAISKIRDSYRVNDCDKQFVKTLRKNANG